MALGVRIFFLGSDDTLKRISHRRFEAFQTRKDAFKEHASNSVRCAFVIVDIENRRPKKIRAIDPIRLYFDASGRYNLTKRTRKYQLTRQAVDNLAASQKDAQVVNISPRIAKKQLDKEFRWVPSHQHLRAIEEAVLGRKKAG